MVPVSPLELRVLRAGVVRRVLDAKRLPTIATHYLMVNLPSDSLALLAGLDVGQEVDPVDARELLSDVLSELGEPIDERREVELVAMFLAKLHTQALVPARQTCRRFYQLGVEIECEWPLAQIGELFGFDDEWEASWGRTPAQLSEATAAACEELLRTIEPTLGVLDNAAVSRLSEMVIS